MLNFFLTVFLSPLKRIARFIITFALLQKPPVAAAKKRRPTRKREDDDDDDNEDEMYKPEGSAGGGAKDQPPQQSTRTLRPRKQRKIYVEEDELRADHYMFCDICQVEFVGGCPDHPIQKWDDPNKVLEVKESLLRGAGRGMLITPM